LSRARKLLIFGGLLLAAFGMLYGLHYALFVEHQTLDEMGASLTEGFVAAAERQPAASSGAIDRYAQTKYVYVRQVDVHSHWVGLGMLLIVLGAVFEDVGFMERVRLRIAIMLLSGAAIFPLGVWLQTARQGPLPNVLAIGGAALVTSGLILTAIGIARKPVPRDARH
jgi:hypothetical protein